MGDIVAINCVHQGTVRDAAEQAPVRDALNTWNIPILFQVIKIRAITPTPEWVNLLQASFSAPINSVADQIESWRGPFRGRTYTDATPTNFPADQDPVTFERDSGTGWAKATDQVITDGGPFTTWTATAIQGAVSHDTRRNEESGETRRTACRSALMGMVAFDPTWFTVSQTIPKTYNCNRQLGGSSPITPPGVFDGNFYKTADQTTLTSADTGNVQGAAIGARIFGGDDAATGNVSANGGDYERVWVKAKNPMSLSMLYYWFGIGFPGPTVINIYASGPTYFLKKDEIVELPESPGSVVDTLSGYAAVYQQRSAIINQTPLAWIAANDPGAIYLGVM